MPSGSEKSMITSSFVAERQAATVTARRVCRCRRPRRCRCPARGWPAASRAATTVSDLSSWASWTMRWPMRPQAPLTPMIGFHGWIFGVDVRAWTPVALCRCSRLQLSRVHLDRLDDLVQVVGHLHRPVGERGPADAAVAQHLVERLLVGAVIGDGRGRVLELVAGQDADDALARRDDAFARAACGRRRRWPPTPVRSRGRRRRPWPWRRGSPGRSPRAPRRRSSPGPAGLGQVHRPVDLDGAGDRGGPDLLGVQALRSSRR